MNPESVTSVPSCGGNTLCSCQLFQALTNGEGIRLWTILFPNVFAVRLRLPCASVAVYFTVITSSLSILMYLVSWKTLGRPSPGEVWRIMHEVVSEQRGLGMPWSYSAPVRAAGRCVWSPVRHRLYSQEWDPITWTLKEGSQTFSYQTRVGSLSIYVQSCPLTKVSGFIF